MILTLELIDRAINERLRLATVAGGYAPDRLAYPTFAAYQAVTKTWEQVTGKPLIEVYGVGNYDTRPIRIPNALVINRVQRVNGSLGAGHYVLTRQSNGRFVKEKLPGRSYDVTYQIQYVTVKSHVERLIQGLLAQALPVPVFVRGLTAERLPVAEGFWLYGRGDADTSGPDYMERTNNFIVRDVFLEPTQVLLQEIPEIREYKPEATPELGITPALEG